MFDHSSRVNVGEAKQTNTQNYCDHSLNQTIVVQERAQFFSQTENNGHLAHAGMRVLHSNISEGAFHDSNERCDSPNFHPETTLAVREKIMGWISKSNQRETAKVIWLSGPAECGKTAIVGSVAEVCKEEGDLATSFFASGTGSEKRCHKQHLIPTLAYGLTQHNSPLLLRDRVLTSIGRDPSVFSKRLHEQCKLLFLKPFFDAQISSDRSFVMIIDGLERLTESDGAQNGNGAVWREVLAALQSVVEDPAFPFRVLIVSRPEREIQEFFATQLDKISKRISLDNKYDHDSYKVSQDMQREKEELTKSLPVLQSALRKQQQDASNLGEENKNLKKEREEMMKSLADLRGTLRRKQQDADNLKDENKALMKVIQDLREVVVSHQEAQAKLETTVEGLIQQMSKAQFRADGCKTESKRVRDEFDALKAKAIQETGRLREANRRLEKDTNELKENNRNLRTRFSEKEKVHTQLVEQWTRPKSHVDQYKLESERLQSALNTLKPDHRTLLALDAGKIKEKNKDLVTALSAEQKANASLQLDMEKLNEKHRRTRSWSEQYRNESERLRKQLDSLEAIRRGDMMAQVWRREDEDAATLYAGRRGRGDDRSRDSSHHSGSSRHSGAG